MTCRLKGLIDKRFCCFKNYPSSTIHKNQLLFNDSFCIYFKSELAAEIRFISNTKVSWLKWIFFKMNVSEKISKISDRGGSRSGTERRRFTIKGYMSERRSGRERRSGNDRRKAQKTRDGMAVERREIFR